MKYGDYIEKVKEIRNKKKGKKKKRKSEFDKAKKDWERRRDK